LRPNGKLWRGGNVEENVGKTWEKVKMRKKNKLGHFEGVIDRDG